MGCIAVHRLLARPLWCRISCAPRWTASTSHLAHHSGRCRSLPGLHLPTLVMQHRCEGYFVAFCIMHVAHHAVYQRRLTVLHQDLCLGYVRKLRAACGVCFFLRAFPVSIMGSSRRLRLSQQRRVPNLTGPWKCLYVRHPIRYLDKLTHWDV
ncbi:hypothetical protein B0H11DRAFT_487924 [Mycena galericulata]|nr:hypothetical protein B0H11DRAFT_487924 [Mycena galericulata]